MHSNDTEIQLYLAEVFLGKEPVSSSKIAQQIVTVLSHYGVSLDKDASYGTDDASSMLYSIQRSLPNFIHLLCIAHIFNLVVKACMQSFAILLAGRPKLTHISVTQVHGNNDFSLFKSSLSANGETAPIPIATRWIAMFDAVANYHTDYLAADKLFLLLETDMNDRNEAVMELKQILDSKYKFIVCE